MLCVAYAATIGGLGTLVGTATNALVVGFMQQNYGETISFAQWLAFGIPTVLLLMPIAWLVLVKFAFPFQLGSQTIARDRLIDARAALGPMTTAERRVTTVFVVTALAWITGPLLRQLPGLAEFNDTTIALLAGLFLFLIQNGSKEGGALLTGPDLRRVPWDVLLLFGGGLALAEAIQGSGLSGVLGEALAGIGAWPLVALLASMVALLVLWTEFNSNVATAATFMPILAAIATVSDYPGAAARGAGGARRVLRIHAAGRHAAERHRVRDRAALDAGHDSRRLARQPRRDRRRDRRLDDRDPADCLSGYFSFSLLRMRPFDEVEVAAEGGEGEGDQRLAALDHVVVVVFLRLARLARASRPKAHRRAGSGLGLEGGAGPCRRRCHPGMRPDRAARRPVRRPRRRRAPCIPCARTCRRS